MSSAFPKASLLLVAALFLVHAAPLAAQNHEPPKAQRPEPPPPPIFPKHRRGLYVNRENVEVIDATPQSPPLEIDDPSVPDKGEYEINLLTEADLGTGTRSLNVLTVDANYGIVLKAWGYELPTQVKLELPLVASEEHGNPYQIGLGTSAFGLKFNFYNDESRGLRIATYPQLEFSTPGSGDKGIAEAGQTLMLPLLVSHESKYVTMVANAAINKAIHDAQRETTTDLGFGFGRAFFRKLAIMADVHTSSTMDFRRDRLISTDAGFIYGVRKAIWYGRLGHSIFSDDGPHTFIAFGLKVLIDTQH